MTVGPGGIAGHLDDFVRAVRGTGIPVGISAAVDAAQVLTVIDLRDREQLRDGLAAVLLSRANQRRAYDVLFDLWWPLSDRSEPGDGARGGAADGADDAAEAGPDGPEATSRVRAELVRVLLDGDESALRRFAREAVERFGRATPSASGQLFFTYRVMRVLDPDSLVDPLLAGLLSAGQGGAVAATVARGEVTERLGAFRAAVEGDVRRRQADERGREAVARSAVRPLAEQLDFLRAQSSDLAELRRSVAPLARRLAARLSARRRSAHAGRLDFRRTVRASMATGGVPLVTKHKPRTVRKPELVVLCDISGSVAGFSHFTLMLTQALREHFTGVRAFAFVDSTDEVTRFFHPGADVVDAVRRIGVEADVIELDGHSDYGHALQTFAEGWGSVVGPRTSLLVLGDGRSNYRPPGLAVLVDLVARSRTAHWLNPEPMVVWGSGDSVADRYREVIEMVECRNAAQLTEFVATL